MDQEPRIWPRKPFCAAHNMGETTFHKFVKEGRIAVVKVGRRTGVTREEAQRFRASLTASNQPADA